MRWTAEQYKDYIASREIDLKSGIMVADEGPESELQGKITKYCKDHGYPCLSFRQSRKAEGFLTPGWPDLTICLSTGRVRVVFIEVKSKKGYLRQKQKEIKAMMKYLGHEWYVVKSYKRFIEIIEGEGIVR